MWKLILNFLFGSDEDITKEQIEYMYRSKYQGWF